MVVCAVAGCGSNSNVTSNYTFHRIPKSPIQRARWALALGLMSHTSYVCSRHFEPSMFIKSRVAKALRRNAVPELFLDSSRNDEASSHLAECSDEAGEAEARGLREELVACRVCLAAEGRLYAISGSGFEDALATLTGVAMPEVECLPRHLCVFCMAKLSKCVAFRDSCQRSTALLQSLLEKGPLKMNDITAIDRDAHQLTNNLAWTRSFQLVTNLLPEVVPVVKIEKNDNSHEETDYIIGVEHLDSDDCVKNDSNDVDKYTFESSVETIKTENPDKQLKIDDHIEINDEKCTFEILPEVKTETRAKRLKSDETDTSDVDTDTSEDHNIRKKSKPLKKNTRKVTKTTKSYEVPPSIDMKAFEKKYNVEYKFLNKEEQMQEIEERKSSNTLKYCCDMCGRSFRREHSMVNHLWTHNPRLGPHECDVCRKRFRASHKLLRHRYDHRDRFTCRQCGLVIRDRTRVKSHFKVHEGSSHACPHCSEAYALRASYYNHIRTRHPDQNEACDQCGETFLSPAGVRLHKALSHRPIDKAILKCKDCDVTFSSAEALQRHSALGAGVPHAALWACAACGDSCGSEPALAAHAAEKHPPEQLHCDKCDKKFASAAAFSLHEARKHRGERATPLMNTRPFRRKITTTKRRKAGTGPSQRSTRPSQPGTRPRKPGTRRSSTGLVCEICGQLLQSTQHLEHHRNSHFGIKPFSCAKCDKRFTTKMGQQNHMLVHTGERPFACDQCGQAFSVQGNLLRHVKNVHMRVQATCELCGKSMAASSLTNHVRDIHRRAGQPRPKRDREREKRRRAAQS